MEQDASGFGVSLDDPIAAVGIYPDQNVQLARIGEPTCQLSGNLRLARTAHSGQYLRLCTSPASNCTLFEIREDLPALKPSCRWRELAHLQQTTWQPPAFGLPGTRVEPFDDERS
ncbi:hypothetical protein ACFWRG_14005 [Micromonospora tulbaghiae]|uniref:hypothetical protein n=1 Tax=Micromonospora tulbaghiae TaxID=479978 RepID=UPI00365FF51A